VTDQPIERAGFESLEVERIDSVLRIALARGELNAIDAILHWELAEAFRLLRREASARAVVITGKGATFSAGGDFDWFPSLHEVERLEELRRVARQLIWDLVEVEIPVVAAINGPAVGLGATIALLCDVILMAETATISDPHVRVGIAAGDGGTAIWPLLVGPARAKQYLLTGDVIPAGEAERIGLVNQVVPPADLQEQALELARRLAAGAPLAIRYTKAAINKLVKDALGLSFDYATGLELLTLLSADHQEALQAIAGKREPRFEGR
jgi:enoyl-CoA hydratase